jgi:hypothetical protein
MALRLTWLSDSGLWGFRIPEPKIPKTFPESALRLTWLSDSGLWGFRIPELKIQKIFLESRIF